MKTSPSIRLKFSYIFFAILEQFIYENIFMSDICNFSVSKVSPVFFSGQQLISEHLIYFVEDAKTVIYTTVPYQTLNNSR